MSRSFLPIFTLTTLVAASLTLPVAGCAMTEAAGLAAFLPPPPALESQLKADEDAHRLGIELRTGERLHEARFDSQKVNPAWIRAMMSPVVGFEITKEKTPAVNALIVSTLQASKNASRAAKGRFFGRLRPFAEHPEDSSCNREVREQLNARASYPSGHTTAVWTAGLALSAAMPEKAAAILDRAYRAGENRWICGHHWKSDVEAGRALAAAVYARLSADIAFQAQLAAAREEIARLE